MANFTCPNAHPTAYHACASSPASHFVGCCTTDPCTLGCTAGALLPASYNTRALPDPAAIPPLECYDDVAGAETGARFYVCPGANPPFIGCCRSDPCAEGCPPGDLSPARWADGDEGAAAFYGAVVPAGGNGSVGGGEGRRDGGGTVVGAAVGGAVGGLVVVGVLVGVWWWRRRRAAGKRRRGDGEGGKPGEGGGESAELSTSKSVMVRPGESFRAPSVLFHADGEC